MARSNPIAHVPNQKIVIIREDYLAICEGDHCKAAILNVFEYWHSVKLANAAQAETENKIAQAGDAPEVDASLWIWKSVNELGEELLGLFGETKIGKSLLWMCEKKFLEKRRNPKYGWDRTLQYAFQPENVQKALNSLSCRKNTASIPQNNGINTVEKTDQSRKKTEAIPEITPETTLETTKKRKKNRPSVIPVSNDAGNDSVEYVSREEIEAFMNGPFRALVESKRA